jgi:hypothetical protein
VADNHDHESPEFSAAAIAGGGALGLRVGHGGAVPYFLGLFMPVVPNLFIPRYE